MFTYNPYYVPPIPDQQAHLKTNAGSAPVWVQGEAGAKSYLVAPNTTVMLMDSESSRFFMKSADQSGMPLPLRVFEFKEVTASNLPPTGVSFDPDKFVTKEELAALLAELPTCKCSKKKKEEVSDEPFA